MVALTLAAAAVLLRTPIKLQVVPKQEIIMNTIKDTPDSGNGSTRCKGFSILSYQ